MPWTIHKQIIPIELTSVLEFPTNAEIFKVGKQKDDLVVWYRFDTENTETQKSTFRLKLTGEIIENDELKDYRYIDTIVGINNLVFHVYVRLNFPE